MIYRVCMRHDISILGKRIQPSSTDMIMEAHSTRKCASKFVYRIFLTPGIFFRSHVRMNEPKKMPRVKPIKTNGLPAP